MSIIKKATALILMIIMVLCCVGCKEDGKTPPVEGNFTPAGVYILDHISDESYEYIIDNAEYAKKMWDKFNSYEIQVDTTAGPDANYLLLRFYNADVSLEDIVVIYENGSCCIDRDYKTYYKLENGRQAYTELAEMYESSECLILADKYTE